MKILVTGADGFIGSHLVEMLVREGHQVRAFVMYNSFNSWGWLDRAAPDLAGSFEVVAGDVRDAYCVREAVKNCDSVLHLAALISIPYSYNSPQAYVDTNVNGTLNVLQAARDFNVGYVLVTSTSEVYGTARFVPITEDHPLDAQSPYAATKVAADQLALAFHRCFDLPVAILRPFNTYGPRQSARAVIPTIISQIAAGERKVRLGSLHPTRDFTFVKDTAKGFIAAVKCDATVGRVTNIGTGFEISIGDLISVICDVMGAKVEIIVDEERVRPAAGEVERLCAGTADAERLFGWQPEYGGRDGLARGLAETFEWFLDPSNASEYKSQRYNV